MTPAKKRNFCQALANGASPTSAAKALGVARSTVYYQRDADPEFAAAWEDALERDADRYEEALEHLATRTRNVGAVIFALKNKRPEKWRDRHDVETRRSTEVTVVLSAETRAKLDRARDRLLLPAA